MWDIALSKTIGSFHLDATLVSKAKRCVIIGGSGTGKTLLLKMIAGMVKPDKGHIQIAGHRVEQLDMAQRKVAYLFQDYALFPHLTVAQQVAFSTRSGWLNPPKRIAQDDKVKYWLQALEIAHLANFYPWQLSGGQQQRTALARLLISQPDILLFDEPFAALDTSLRDQMRRLLDQWQQRLDLPMLIITHDPDDAQVFGDDVWQMVREDNQATLQRISSADNHGHTSRLRLLAQLAQQKALTTIAHELDMTIAGVHHAIDALNNFAGTALVQRREDTYQVTEAGRQWLQDYQLATYRQQRFIAHLPNQQQEVLMASYLQTSAHNELRGQISAIEVGAVNVQVSIAIGGGQLLTAIVSKSSAERLKLTQGMQVIALINASDVLLSTQSLTSVLSARNQLSGKVQRIEKGAVNDEIFINLGDGTTLAAIITHESAEQLAIEVGHTVYALIKAPNVMLATLPLT